MKKHIKGIVNATSVFLVLYFFRQAIDYFVNGNGDFFVGNFDIFYVFGLIYAAKYIIIRKRIEISRGPFLLLVLLITLISLQMMFILDANAIKIIINALKIVVCFLTMMYVKDNVSRVDLKYFCFGFGALCVIFLALSFVFPGSVLWRHNDYVNVFAANRLQFLFSEPSELGLHAVIVLIFAIHFFVVEKKYTIKKVFSYIILIFLPVAVSLYLAKPLGAVAFGVVAVLVYLIANVATRKNKKISMIALIGTITVIIGGGAIVMSNENSISSRVVAVLNGTDSSVNYRIAVPLKIVGRSLIDSKGIGLGLGNAKLENNVAIYKEIGLSSAGVINSFFNLVAEGGIVGMIFVMAVVVALVRASLKEKSSIKLALTVFILLFQFAGTYFTNPLCWLLYGYILFAKEVDNGTKDQIGRKDVKGGRAKKDKEVVFLDDNINTVGGVERIISILANSLVRQYRVSVISKDKTRGEPFYKYDKAVERLYLIDKLNGGFLVYVKNKVERVVFLKRRLVKILKMRGSNPDVIVFGRVSNALLFLPVIASVYRKNMPKIIVRDAIHLSFLSNSQKRKMRRLFPRYVDVFIVSSHESIESYKSFFGSASIRMEIIYNPIGIKPKVGYNFKSKTLLAMGRMDDNQKGFDCLINSFKYIHNKYPDWKLCFYGDGKMKPRYITLARNLGLGENIEFKNTSNSVVDIFNSASIFVFPSRYEGYANILVEALACGVPSITFDWLMGADEIIEDKKNGSIVKLKDRLAYFNGANDRGDQVNFADEVCRLIANPDVAAKYSTNGVSIVEGRSVGCILKKWLQLIGEDSV